MTDTKGHLIVVKDHSLRGKKVPQKPMSSREIPNINYLNKKAPSFLDLLTDVKNNNLRRTKLVEEVKSLLEERKQAKMNAINNGSMRDVI